MNLSKDILLSMISDQSIELDSLKVLYDWEIPADNASFTTPFGILYNSLYSKEQHFIEGSTTKLSSEIMFGTSVGLTDNGLGTYMASNRRGEFAGDDIVYITNSNLISNWTIFIDIYEILCPTDKSKSRIILTNKNKITDTTGFVIGVNGANCLFYEGSNSNGDKIIKTLVHPIGERNLIAISRSNDSISIYVCDPIQNTIVQKSFSINETWTSGQFCLGGTYTNFVTDDNYEKLEGRLDSFALFDNVLNNSNITKLFEAFSLTSYTAKRYEDVATQVPVAGQYVETQVEDGFKTAGYEYAESHILDASGNIKLIYNKVPKLEKKYKTVNQFVAGVGTTTKMVRTLIPESKTKDVVGAQEYVEKCILLDKNVDKSQRVEFYSRDDYVGNCGKKATFAPSDSSFYLDTSYSDPINIIIYLNGLLIEPDVDYEIVDGRTVKRLNGVFLETDEVIYDTYSNQKEFTDFYGYNGDIYLYGLNGYDAYLNGKKLIWKTDYEDYSNFLILHGSGLSAGRLGLITRSSDVTHNENFYNKYYHCNNYNVIDEQVWIDGGRVYKNSGYSLNCVCNLNNSNNKAEEKTTIIYNNESGYFSI